METRTADPATEAPRHQAPVAEPVPSQAEHIPSEAAGSGPSRTAAADPDRPDRTDDLTARLSDQLLGLSRRLHRAQRHRLEPLGITPAQARLLRALSHWDAHGAEPPRMADLAQRLEVVPRAVTTLVDALEERELVRRAPDPSNRRVIRIQLTEGGRSAVQELRQARRTAAAEILSPLDGDARAALTRLLAVLDREEPEGAGPSR
ncbi:MarR family winged helix-turn-helix transcriptional regulator [Streptomyces sp. NPDC021020]|uniref:MarR family winged helix-turn-helix transcriptional regulator n=1 Tax=Streptomyces sp. NPDC021020 TaxID=3365109 RepID=UPI0037A473F6